MSALGRQADAVGPQLRFKRPTPSAFNCDSDAAGVVKFEPPPVFVLSPSSAGAEVDVCQVFPSSGIRRVDTGCTVFACAESQMHPHAMRSCRVRVPCRFFPQLSYGKRRSSREGRREGGRRVPQCPRVPQPSSSCSQLLATSILPTRDVNLVTCNPFEKKKVSFIDENTLRGPNRPEFPKCFRTLCRKD